MRKGGDLLRIIAAHRRFIARNAACDRFHARRQH
jgi:hypothetical protein